jgi:hypothetical protein
VHAAHGLKLSRVFFPFKSKVNRILIITFEQASWKRQQVCFSAVAHNLRLPPESVYCLSRCHREGGGGI